MEFNTVALLLGSVLFLLLLLIFVSRKLPRRYPFFFSYLIASLLAAWLQFLFHGQSLFDYFKVSWATEALSICLTLLAVCEAIRRVFILNSALWQWLFPAAAFALCIIYAISVPNYAIWEASPAINAILQFERAVNDVVCVAFILFLISVLIGLIREKIRIIYAHALVLGFMVFIAGTVASIWLHPVFGARVYSLVRFSPAISYVLALVIWIAGCFLPDSSASAISP
jgi:hypothetical protein